MPRWIKVAVIIALTLPAVALRLAGVHLPPPVAILIFGGGARYFGQPGDGGRRG